MLRVNRIRVRILRRVTLGELGARVVAVGVVLRVRGVDSGGVGELVDDCCCLVLGVAVSGDGFEVVVEVVALQGRGLLVSSLFGREFVDVLFVLTFATVFVEGWVHAITL